MKLFNWFRKPQLIQDPFFGKLRFASFSNIDKNYFEGRIHFEATGNEIQLIIEAGQEGPGAPQQQFYRQLESRYKLYVPQIIPLLEEELRHWKAQFRILDFLREFTLISATIPRNDQGVLKWNLSFSTIHDENHTFIVNFINDEPQGVLIDG